MSENWSKSKFSVDYKEKKAKEVIFKINFWNGVTYTLKITSPLEKMLNVVDGDKQPIMDYIYDTNDKVKHN